MSNSHFESMTIEGQRGAVRPVRLYHWQQALSHRVRAEEGAQMDSTVGAMIYTAHTKLANTHLSFVQSLNVFFDHGDTAEADAAFSEAVNTL